MKKPTSKNPEPHQVSEHILITIGRVNELLEVFDEFRLQSFDSWTLRIITCWDLTYHHNLEVTFIGVSFTQCATDFRVQVFRLATDHERGEVGRKTDLESNQIVFCLESDDRHYFIVAGLCCINRNETQSVF